MVEKVLRGMYVGKYQINKSNYAFMNIKPQNYNQAVIERFLVTYVKFLANYYSSERKYLFLQHTHFKIIIIIMMMMMMIIIFI